MVKYKCFNCNKRVGEEYVGKRVRCPYCGTLLRSSPRGKRRRAREVKAVEIPPDLERELDKIEVKVRVKHRSG